MLEQLFKASVANPSISYKSLYACQCPFLHPDLPFRTECTQAILADIQKRYPVAQTDHLVYVCQGPGGFLWDFHCINNLIHRGYRSLTLIFIEPLYEKKLTILQAYFDFKEWCTELQKMVPYDLAITCHLYKNFLEYKKACKQNSRLQGDILISIDPDDATTVPDFNSQSFIKKFTRHLKTVMHPSCRFYYLYFQKSGGHPYRHMILGAATQTQKTLTLSWFHYYGIESVFEQKHIRLIHANQEILPFRLEHNLVQSGTEIITSTVLAELLKNPLQ